MADLQEHCDECQKKLGQPFREVHIWLDQYFDIYSSQAHRDALHNLVGVERVRQEWGDQAAEAAILHICRDWKIIFSQIPKDRKAAELFRQSRQEEHFKP